MAVQLLRKTQKHSQLRSKHVTRPEAQTIDMVARKSQPSSESYLSSGSKTLSWIL